MSSHQGEPDVPSRRFRPGRRATDRWAESSDAVATLEAELVLLREENARLKIAAQRESPDVGELLDRARAVQQAATDQDSTSDEVTHLLVEALVMRESLAEICEELERTMVAFRAKLNALGAAAGQGQLVLPSDERKANGTWP